MLEKARAEELIKKTNDLAESSKQNAKLQEELKNQFTGGETKPILHIETWNLNRKDYKIFAIYFNLKNEGKYALQDVKATIIDWSGFLFTPIVEMTFNGLTSRSGPSQNKNITAANWDVNKNFNIGAIAAGNKNTLYIATYSNDQRLWGNFNHDNHDEVDYKIRVNWLSGELLFQIRLKIIGDAMVVVYKYCMFNGKKYDVDKQFQFN